MNSRTSPPCAHWHLCTIPLASELYVCHSRSVVVRFFHTDRMYSYVASVSSLPFHTCRICCRWRNTHIRLDESVNCGSNQTHFEESKTPVIGIAIATNTTNSGFSRKNSSQHSALPEIAWEWTKSLCQWMLVGEPCERCLATPVER